jgi:hypothetical protein
MALFGHPGRGWSRLLPVLALSLCLVSLVPATTAQSGSLGVTPAEVQVTGAQPGQSYQRTVTVQNAMDTPTVFTLGLHGATAPWTQAQPAQQLQVPAGSSASITLTFNVPEDAYIGPHTGQLSINADPQNQPSGSGLATSWGVTVLFHIDVGGEAEERLTWTNAQAEDVEIGTPPRGHITVTNSGNVLSLARVQAQVLAFDTDTILAETTGQATVIPGQHTRIDLDFDTPLELGQYRMRFVSLNDGHEATDGFKVVPVGALGKEGLLRFIEHEPWVQAGRPVRLTAVFENIGTITISQAAFTAEVYKDGRLLFVTESGPLVVRPGERSELVVYYTPEEPGEHRITGRVAYDGFQTLKSESILNVEPSTTPATTWLLLVPMLLAGIIVYAGYQVHRRTRATGPIHHPGKRGPRPRTRGTRHPTGRPQGTTRFTRKR